jgi:hypothetical protein
MVNERCVELARKVLEASARQPGSIGIRVHRKDGEPVKKEDVDLVRDSLVEVLPVAGLVRRPRPTDSSLPAVILIIEARDDGALYETTIAIFPDPESVTSSPVTIDFTIDDE